MSSETPKEGSAAQLDASAPAQAAWAPRITAFVCRWCTYAGADLAGTSRLKYPPDIRLIKLPCTGRIDPLFLLRAFAMGSDGILVSGCHPGDCHYTSGNYAARRRWVIFKELLDFVGLEPGRVTFSWVSAAEGAKFVDVVTRVTNTVRSLGPFTGFAPAGDALSRGWADAAPVDAGVVPGAGAATDGESAMKADRSAIGADLASGAVKAVLARRCGRRADRTRAAWADGEAELDGLDLDGEASTSIVTHLVRRLRADPLASFGIVATPVERDAIARLIAEHQIDPDRVRVYPRGGQAAARMEGARASLGVPGPESQPAERWAFWTSAFARCLRCYACREGCPMCACLRCVSDKTRPRWIDASPTPAGNWIWNVTRAFHQAGRCVECGACVKACPAGIPLMALSKHLNRVVERAFGSGDASDEALRSPLLEWSPEDERAARFIL